MSFHLRDYQQVVVDKVKAALRQGHKKILIVAPTGAGKTAISTSLSRGCYAKGNDSMFICHRRELVSQTFKTYLKNDLEPSFIQGGKRYDPTNPVQIASINTLVGRLDKIKQPSVVFWDETHHLAASQWEKVFKRFDSSIHIGLTGTPIRLDGKPLGNFYDVMVEAPTPKWLMEQGYLVNYQYFAPSEIDRSELKVRNGKFTEDSIEELGIDNSIVGDNIQFYLKHANGKRNVVFARNVSHSLDIVDRYNKAGVPAMHLDGNTPTKIRDKAIKDFEDGKILVLSNVDLFGEGFDLPAIEVVSILRPTNSLSFIIQAWGRSLRPVYAKGFDLSTQQGRLDAIQASDKKFAVIFDHCNNWQDHGFPCDERTWSLEQGIIKPKKSKEDDSLSMRTCKKCFRPHIAAVKCPHCGYEYQADGKVIKEVAGELVLVNSDEFKQAMKREIVTAETFDDLVRIEGEMSYKVGWAENQWKYKTGEDLKGSLAGFNEIAKVRGYKRGWAYGQAKRKGLVR